MSSAGKTTSSSGSGGSTPQARLRLTLTRCTFSNRRYNAVYIRNSVDLTMTDCYFWGNINNADGAAIRMSASDDPSFLTATGCVFANNYTWGSYDGGAIWVGGAGTTATLTDCTFENNGAGSDGGAIEVEGGAILDATRVIFRKNEARAGGGAVSFEAGAAKGTFTDCIIEDNVARGFLGGGGIVRGYDVAGPITLVGTTRITGNRSRDAEFEAGGIATFIDSSSTVIPANVFVGTNSTTVYGNAPKQCMIRSEDDASTKAWVEVDCATWCLPAGSIVATSQAAVCCSGTQNAGVCT
jgi:predicted outer membrane repeat protein